ncbi:MAG: hypothetical protein Q8922_04470 [Bacteroidota bacterium]|nr:hypothetical protein [Bacteroidota bacterium]MDP4231835.1 hypothetical protein [Bacteroidota bacterium]MDP4242721.1 hypothetical protein [Bacteroidota bacterium]MDP4287172.1 hypothetical protein [Bacteroidota bacterium]
MEIFELEIISGIIDGRIADINTFMLQMGGLQPGAPPSFGSVQLRAPDDGRILVLSIPEISYVPTDFDETAIRVARFRNLIRSLANSEYITLSTKPGTDLNRLGTICLLETNRQLNFAFYKDNWDLLFKKILPLPGLSTLFSEITQQQMEKPAIGFKLGG